MTRKPGHRLPIDRPSDYEVGYARPPDAARFKQGQSGNPKGRPKGSRNEPPSMNEERLKDIVMAEACRGNKVNDGDRQVAIPMAQAVIRSMALDAAKGQHRSQRLFAELVHRRKRAARFCRTNG